MPTQRRDVTGATRSYSRRQLWEGIIETDPKTHPIINTVMIDCRDAESLAAFWSELLGVGVRARFGGFLWLEPQRGGGYSLAFQEVDDPTPGKNRLHLDGMFPDLALLRDRIEELGGSYVRSESVPDFEWVVFADPDGNVFCIGHGD